MAIEYGYRRMKFFFVQLLVSTFAEIVSASCYKSITRSTPLSSPVNTSEDGKNLAMIISILSILESNQRRIKCADQIWIMSVN